MEWDDIKDEPDAAIFKHGLAINEFINSFTCPIILFKDKPSVDSLIGCESGILIQIGKRKFLLSAGHSVEDIILYSPNVAIGIKPQPHRTMLNFKKHYWDNPEGPDIGFIEFTPDQASTIENYGSRNFMSLDRIELSDSETLNKCNDWMIISGFPKNELNSDKSNDKSDLKMLHAITELATSQNAPPSKIRPEKGEHIELWLPEKGNLDVMSGNFEPVDNLPKFAGMSGGGVWRTNFRPIRANWKINDLKISAIHVSSTYPTENRFCRGILIKEHLNLIYNQYPDLRDYLEEIGIQH